MERKASMEKEPANVVSVRKISVPSSQPDILEEQLEQRHSLIAVTAVQKLREEEEKMKKEHDLALNSIRERLSKERTEEEKRLRYVKHPDAV